MSREFTEIDTDTPKGRLLAFCHMMGLNSNREIEKMLELGNGYFRTADKGMNTGTICKVARRYPTLNLNWLICGCGDIYSQDNARLNDAAAAAGVAEPLSHYNNTVATAAYRHPGNVAVRMIESAEHLLAPFSTALPPRWFMMDAQLLRHRDDLLVRITDESLQPAYCQGEYLQITPLPSNALQNRSGDEKRLLLVALKDTRPLIRLAGRYAGHAEMCILSALNPDKTTFPDLLCTQEQIAALWEVVNVFHL